ncbi:cytochrome c oxidase subunit II [Sphingomonas sp. PL-96]|uniref:cytochrome c oxidase subunit II n=1 Tax=Sphingomonas sp. PL-96 TaxID=2887201 RepID=UPI001E5B2574|nr:cytochrome c oxidase subunit II [Sphingomonas sp. PL-96]MCC2977262.1 cytochrome c oxidase subunit II [Sphingomonas sp. PL-96]
MRGARRGGKFGLAAAATLLIGGCNRHQSALAPFGADAADIRSLTLVLVIGSAVILGVLALLWVIAVRAPEGKLTHKKGMRLVLVLGALVPTIVLLALLLYALPMMRPRTATPADLRITVTGEQFWWRVAYQPTGTPPVVAANEVRIPVGRTVVFRLEAQDVIHSFWIPGLAGKMDMIPGRTNELVVRADKAGRYRGACTEFCGLSHALMAFDVVAMEPAAFDRWIATQRRPAPAARRDAAAYALFDSYGCAGCHAIRGTPATATIGPDLTHFGGRPTVAAGTLPMETEAIARFIRMPAETKPGVRMPAFPHMPPDDARRLATYLQGLK